MRSPLLLLLFAGCGSPSIPPRPDLTTALVDAGALDLATDGAALSDDAAPASDGAEADLVWDPSQPYPPAGALKCASGTFTQADSQMVCQQPSFTLDHWGMQGQPFPRDCGAAAIDGGSYDVWCTNSVAYVFFRFVGLRATGTLLCMGTTGLYLSAVDEYGTGGGDTGINPMSGYRGIPDDGFDVNKTIEAHAWLTAGRNDPSATLYLTPLSALLGKCGSMSSGYRTVVAGAIATWQ